MRHEHEENWKASYVEVKESDLPHDTNIVTPHSIYKVKRNNNVEMRLKGRIMVYRNRYNYKDEIREDFAAAYMVFIRLILSIDTLLVFKFVGAHVKGVYMQSGRINRKVYFKPPRDYYPKRFSI